MSTGVLTQSPGEQAYAEYQASGGRWDSAFYFLAKRLPRDRRESLVALRLFRGEYASSSAPSLYDESIIRAVLHHLNVWVSGLESDDRAVIIRTILLLFKELRVDLCTFLIDAILEQCPDNRIKEGFTLAVHIAGLRSGEEGAAVQMLSRGEHGRFKTRFLRAGPGHLALAFRSHQYQRGRRSVIV